METRMKFPIGARVRHSLSYGKREAKIAARSGLDGTYLLQYGHMRTHTDHPEWGEIWTPDGAWSGWVGEGGIESITEKAAEAKP